MSKPILYLFPDTNLFIQCRPLHELPWSELGDFEEIHLVVSRTVQREIDDQKSRGNGRVAQRARSTYPLFRKIVTGNLEYEVVSDNPLVKVFIQSPSLPDEELSKTLDYSKPDEQIVGCCSRYKRENPALDVHLLTHDTGPMMSAKTIKLPFIPIPDKWLIPPEHNESERKIARLESELTQLKRTEPQFRIWCIDENENEVSQLDLAYQIYEPLTEVEVSSLVDSLKRRFPSATEFNRREPKPTTFATGLLGPPRYVPAPDEAIAKYRDEEYPDWLDECENFLFNLHEALQERARLPHFRFLAANEGNRPANNALVVIRSKGLFKIRPPEHIDEEKEAELHLPLPPIVPRGQWKRPSHAFEVLAQGFMTKDIDTMFKLPLPVARYSPLDVRRDPNDFFYKHGRADTPVESFMLECEQWRHGISEEYFDGTIFVESDASDAKGVIECEIHAENLSKPVKEVVTVTIAIEKPSTLSFAQDLISQR